jgi:hypothetical protein
LQIIRNKALLFTNWYAAKSTTRFSAMKKIAKGGIPELKMGEGGGCRALDVWLNALPSAAVKTTLTAEVGRARLMIERPTCKSTRRIAKMTAMRKRGSERY